MQLFDHEEHEPSTTPTQPPVESKVERMARRREEKAEKGRRLLEAGLAGCAFSTSFFLRFASHL